MALASTFPGLGFPTCGVCVYVCVYTHTHTPAYLFFFFFEGTQVLYVARVLNFQSSYLSSVLSHTPPRWLHDALSSGHTICDHGSFLSDPQFPLLRRRTGVEPGTWTTALYCCPLEGQPEGIPSG